MPACRVALRRLSDRQIENNLAIKTSRIVTINEPDNFGWKLNADNVDSIVTAEFPDEENDPELHRIVAENFIHKPYGIDIKLSYILFILYSFLNNCTVAKRNFNFIAAGESFTM